MAAKVLSAMLQKHSFALFIQELTTSPRECPLSRVILDFVTTKLTLRLSVLCLFGKLTIFIVTISDRELVYIHSGLIPGTG